MLILLAAFGLGCAEEEPVSPEQRLRALLERAEILAEAKDAASLGGLVSEDYLDGRGFNKRSLTGLVAYYFNTHERIHLLTRVDAIAFPEPERAEVGLFVAMAGEPVAEPRELTRTRADVYRFDFVFTEADGRAWKLIRAQWRRAQITDLL